MLISVSNFTTYDGTAINNKDKIILNTKNAKNLLSFVTGVLKISAQTFETGDSSYYFLKVLQFLRFIFLSTFFF